MAMKKHVHGYFNHPTEGLIVWGAARRKNHTFCVSFPNGPTLVQLTGLYLITKMTSTGFSIDRSPTGIVHWIAYERTRIVFDIDDFRRILKDENLPHNDRSDARA